MKLTKFCALFQKDGGNQKAELAAMIEAAKSKIHQVRAEFTHVYIHSLTASAFVCMFELRGSATFLMMSATFPQGSVRHMMH